MYSLYKGGPGVLPLKILRKSRMQNQFFFFFFFFLFFKIFRLFFIF